MIRRMYKPPTDAATPQRSRQRSSRSFKKADVQRAIAAMKAGGLSISTVEIRIDGTITINTPEAAASLRPSDIFDEWEARL